jgi:hypothetical protein
LKVNEARRKTGYPNREDAKKGKMMSNSTDQKQEATRIQVGNLPQQEKELKDQEAESVKGGGGLPGGVVPTSHVGEEIPQTVQR